MDTDTPLRVLRAEGSILPIVLFWLFIVIAGRLAKKKKAGEGGKGEGTASAGQGGLLAELKRAMEELKAAEAAERGQLQLPSAGNAEQAQLELRRRYLEEQKQKAAQKRAQRVQHSTPLPARLELPDEEEMSSEDVTVVSLEGQDYDDEAEKIIAARRAAAERRVVREERSAEELTDAQRTRRASRQDLAIGSRAEHEAWHDAIGAEKPPAPAAARKGPLARFADGSPKSALVLSEILGRAVGGRTQDD